MPQILPQTTARPALRLRETRELPEWSTKHPLVSLEFSGNAKCWGPSSFPLGCRKLSYRPTRQAAPTPPSAGGSPPAERRTWPSRAIPPRAEGDPSVTRLTYDTMTRRSGECRPRQAAPSPLSRQKPAGRAANVALTPASWHPTRHRPARPDASAPHDTVTGTQGRAVATRRSPATSPPHGRRRTADEPGAPASLATAECAGDRWRPTPRAARQSRHRYGTIPPPPPNHVHWGRRWGLVARSARSKGEPTESHVLLTLWCGPCGGVVTTRSAPLQPSSPSPSSEGETE